MPSVISQNIRGFFEIYFILEGSLLLAHKRISYGLQTPVRMSQTRDIYQQRLWGSLHKTLDKNAIPLIQISVILVIEYVGI